MTTEIPHLAADGPRLDGQRLVGRLFIHQGDEAEFVAKRFPAR
jgi:hypothetical protein